MAEGLLALYEATADERWFIEAGRAGGGHPGPVRGPDGRLLRHRRRRRAARRPAQGPAGQRRPVRRRGRGHRPAPADGAHRGAAVPRRGRAGDRDGRAVSSRAIRRPLRSGYRRSSSPTPGSRRSRSSATRRIRGPRTWCASRAGATPRSACWRSPPKPDAIRGLAAAPAVRAARPADRLRLPGLLLPPAGARARGPGGPARRRVTSQVSSTHGCGSAPRRSCRPRRRGRRYRP